MAWDSIRQIYFHVCRCLCHWEVSPKVNQPREIFTISRYGCIKTEKKGESYLSILHANNIVSDAF